MKDVNDGIMGEFQAFCEEHSIPVDASYMQELEQARRWTAKTFGSLQTKEDEVDMAMHNEQIMSRHEVNLEQLDWKFLLARDATTFRLWNGLGGAQTATAFIKYV
jgi:hypothetical protein